MRLSEDTVSLMKANDATKALEKYDELLRLVDSRKLSDPDVTKAVSEARDAAERAKGRIGEEKRLASIKANIKGGAWLTKEAGNSETLRGLNILILRSRGKNDQLVAMVRALIDGTNARVVEAKKLLAAYDAVYGELERASEELARKDLSELYGQEFLRQRARLTELMKAQPLKLQEVMRQASMTKGDEPVDMANIFALWLVAGAYIPRIPSPSEGETKVWASICRAQLAGTVHTDVDGKYNIELPGGYYYLYAMLESSNSKVEWFVPVKVAEAKDMAVDLHNENAVRITNKVQ